MLNSLLLLQSLQDAQRVLADARMTAAGSSSVVWMKIHNAQKYLDSQVVELLAPPPADRPQSLLDAAASAQVAYWGALRNLETELGIDLDDVGYLEGLTVKEVIDTYGS